MGLVSYIQGRHVEHVYSVKYERDEKTGKLVKKPKLDITDRFKYETLKREDNRKYFIVDGEIGSNTSNKFLGLYSRPSINISEDETVDVVEKIYRADLNAYMIHTGKVMSEKDVDKEESDAILEKLMREYNEMKISEDDELATYCRVHKLVPAETDYDELRSIVKKNLYGLEEVQVKVAALDLCNSNLTTISNGLASVVEVSSGGTITCN